MTVEALTHLTFQHHRAGEAVECYVRLVPGSRIESRRPAGDDGREIIAFTLAGRRFLAADSPPMHEWDFTPAVSVFLECDSPGQVDALVAGLGDGGVEFMPPGDYGFSPRFGWVRDRFGVSWQVGLPLT